MEIFLKILKVILKILNVLFVILGVIFAIIICAAIWFYVADPLDLRPIIEPMFFGDQGAALEGLGNSPFLTGQQEQVLGNIGVNLEDLPSQITPQMETCFVENLGMERIKYFESGGTPSLSDFLKVKSCLTQ
ncbi:MAG: hypothetical protein U9P90_04415 [Patescibacteria group bacterium]|nr:hypothetical protein [Patescibacteria group bacterium]